MHRHQPVVDEDFFGEEIGADGGLVAGGELLVDLGWVRWSSWVRVDARTYWFMREVLPTPLSPRMMTCVAKCQCCFGRHR